MTNPPKYRWLRNSILAFAVLAAVWAVAFIQISWVIALVPLFISHLLILYPTLVPHSQWWGPVMRSFETSRKEVWITIDDGPTIEHTEKILNLLDRYDARATFFVIGERVKKYPQLIAKILERGHQVSNHTLTHPSGSFWCALRGKIFAQIDGCNEAIGRKQVTSRANFRAPAGLKNFLVHDILRRRNMHLIGWSARGFDTGKRPPEEVAARIIARTGPGAIVLLHEGHQVGTMPEYNPACIEQTLRGLKKLGYSFVIPRLPRLQTRAAER